LIFHTAPALIGLCRLGFNRAVKMKTNKLSVPISITAALVGLVACGLSCAKKSNAPEKPLPPPSTPLPTNSVTDNTTNAVMGTNNASAETAANITNVVPTTPAPIEITNPPPAETTIKAPETAPMTDTNLPGHNTVVEMPAAAPAAPTNFYPTTIASNNKTSMSPVTGSGSTNLFLALRGGYEHVYHGDNNDSYWASAKLYAYGDGLREDAGKNGWLIPDADLEVSSGDIAKPDDDPHPGSDAGLRLRADFTWPWFHWTTYMFGHTDSVCPFCQPLTLGLGPTVNVGFDHLYNETDFRFANYAGVRLTFNRNGFIEYTVGRTEGLDSMRQQVVAEIPFYQSHDGAVRYYVRGLWNHGTSSKPDVIEGGIFLEMPLGLLVSPEKWGDLVPFGN
jgi:hypothetical protein